MTSFDFQNPEPTPRNTVARLTVEWGSGGEAYLNENVRDAISDAIDDVDDGKYRAVFPVHCPHGAIALDIDGRTLWLYSDTARIVGELVDPSIARPRSVPASGTVNISALPKEAQDALMTILKMSGKK